MDVDQLKVYEEFLLKLIKILFFFEVEVYRSIEFVYLNMLLEKFCVMFEDGVFMQFKFDLLKVVLCYLLQYFFKYVLVGYEFVLLVRKVYVRNICRVFVNVFGVQVDVEVSYF